MAAQHFFTPAEIIEIAAHYGALGERWIITRREHTRVFGYRDPVAVIPIRCKTLRWGSTGARNVDEERQLRVKLDGEMIRCSVRAPKEVDNHVNMSFTRLDADDFKVLPYSEQQMSGLFESNHEFIAALDLIATELDRVQETFCHDVQDVFRRGAVDCEGCKKLSFRQSVVSEAGALVELDTPIYRVQLPVCASGRIGVQRSGDDDVIPSVYTPERRDGVCRKVELMHGGRHLDCGNVAAAMPRFSAIWGNIRFPSISVFRGFVSASAACDQLIAMAPRNSRAEMKEEYDEGDDGDLGCTVSRERAEGELEVAPAAVGESAQH